MMWKRDIIWMGWDDETSGNGIAEDLTERWVVVWFGFARIVLVWMGVCARSSSQGWRRMLCECRGIIVFGN